MATIPEIQGEHKPAVYNVEFFNWQGKKLGFIQIVARSKAQANRVAQGMVNALEMNTVEDFTVTMDKADHLRLAVGYTHKTKGLFS